MFLLFHRCGFDTALELEGAFIARFDSVTQANCARNPNLHVVCEVLENVPQGESGQYGGGVTVYGSVGPGAAVGGGSVRAGNIAGRDININGQRDNSTVEEEIDGYYVFNNARTTETLEESFILCEPQSKAAFRLAQGIKGWVIWFADGEFHASR